MIVGRPAARMVLATFVISRLYSLTLGSGGLLGWGTIKSNRFSTFQVMMLK